MTDDEFLAAFFGGELGTAAFRHRDHLRLAWLMVRLPRRHWSEGSLEHGRRAWREPDLAPLP